MRSIFNRVLIVHPDLSLNFKNSQIRVFDLRTTNTPVRVNNLPLHPFPARRLGAPECITLTTSLSA